MTTVITTTILTSALIATTSFYNGLRIQKILTPPEDGFITGHQTYIFDSSSIHVKGKAHQSSFQWILVKSIVHDVGLIMIFLDPTAALILPENQIENVSGFVETLKSYKEAADAAEQPSA